jgi:hypothetical protein
MYFVLHNFIILIQFFLPVLAFSPDLVQVYVDFFFRHPRFNYITNTYHDLMTFLTGVIFKTSDLEPVAIN